MTVVDTVNHWFQERIATGAIARDTPAYNQALAALPNLIARLTTETPAAAAPIDPAAPAPAEPVPPAGTVADHHDDDHQGA